MWLVLMVGGVGTLAFDRREFVRTWVGGLTMVLILLDNCLSNGLES
jgi:hypothetical protein